MRIPDCVPEYYRSQQEADEIKFARKMQAQAHYLANRQKIATAAASGLPVLTLRGPGPCWECPQADRDTMTAADDDFDRVICHDPACPHQKEGTQ